MKQKTEEGRNRRSVQMPKMIKEKEWDITKKWRMKEL